MSVLLFCDVNSEGRITESFAGVRIVPSKQYDHFFYLNEDVEVVTQNIPNYQVIDGNLVLK